MTLVELQALITMLQQSGVVNYETPELKLQIMPRYTEQVGKIKHEQPEEKKHVKGAEMPLSMTMWSTK